MVAEQGNLQVFDFCSLIFVVVGRKRMMKGFLPDPFDAMLFIIDIRNVVPPVAGINALRTAFFLSAFIQVDDHGPTTGGQCLRRSR